MTRRTKRADRPLNWQARLALTTTTAVLLAGCATEGDGEDNVISVGQAATQAISEFTCGYEIETGTYTTWPGGYQAWVRVKNVSGAVGTGFSVFLDVGNTTIQNLYQAEYSQVEGGYLVTEPSWLQYQKIPQGQSYQFGFVGTGTFEDVVPYILTLNDQDCDESSPEVSLTAEPGLLTSAGDVQLVAAANDGVGIRKVVFSMDDEILGEDTEAPFEWSVALDQSDNGRRHFSATAVDPSGNEASATASTLVAIQNRFLGSAPSSDPEFETMLPSFNQLTPENAGKWGNVEATRDQYDWSELDKAYNFSLENEIPFKLHTLVWGQQQPAWLDGLSDEEQLAEIEEWMSDVATRYTHAKWVDVVNEPLHAPPSYAAALGGAGETGWDWVIKSFELARQYFPGTELLLNDYQILILESFTQDYLQIIEILQARGLIDGIGVQAHFLERAEISVVEANLATLAATGLPIYVSEFDVNFADDARHANVLKDLFTAFWENPSVLGVTHWGHLQGDTWQPDTYLINADLTHRPGFDWLLCYYAGESDCTVPEYIPSGWQGTEYGITLQAELYDEAEGLLALGDSVAYTDAGDWLNFIGVEFQDNWDEFSITYAKGNTEIGSVSIKLDSLENDAVFTLDLPPTAGWGSKEVLELPWMPISGTHDVYLVFNDIGGVANVDQIRFGTPPPQIGVNLVEDPGLESGNVGNWGAWYAGGTISTTTDRAHSGNYSLAMTNRTAVGGYSARYLLPNSVITADTTYAVSVWASHNGLPTDTLRLSGIIQCVETDLGHNAYPWIQNNDSVAVDEWVQLAGTMTIPAGCTPQEIAFFVEGTSAGADIFVDDASFINPNIIPNPGFEQGNTDGWSAWYAGGTVELSTDPVNSGGYALALTNRNASAGYSPRYLFSLDQLVPGTTYSVSVFASHNGAANETLRLAAVVQCANPPEGHNAYPWIQNTENVASGAWTQLSGTLNVPDCEPTEVAIFVEGPSAGVDIFVDNVFFGAP